MIRPEPVEWPGDKAAAALPHGTPLLFNGELFAGQRDASFLRSPDVHASKQVHVIVVNRIPQFPGGSVVDGRGAACDPPRLPIGLTDRARSWPAHVRCRRAACQTLFALADHQHQDATTAPPAPSLTRDEAVALVQRIMDAEYADDGEAGRWLERLERAFGCPSGYVSDLIFGQAAEEPTAAQVIDKAVAYRPIAL